jgi:hypothetical protein
MYLIEFFFLDYQLRMITLYTIKVQFPAIFFFQYWWLNQRPHTILGKHSTTELYLQSPKHNFQIRLSLITMVNCGSILIFIIKVRLHSFHLLAA